MVFLTLRVRVGLRVTVHDMEAGYESIRVDLRERDCIVAEEKDIPVSGIVFFPSS